MPLPGTPMPPQRIGILTASQGNPMWRVSHYLRFPGPSPGPEDMDSVSPRSSSLSSVSLGCGNPRKGTCSVDRLWGRVGNLSPEKRGKHSRNPHGESTPHLYDGPSVYRAVLLQPRLFFLTGLLPAPRENTQLGLWSRAVCWLGLYASASDSGA